jgi:hypothetical protein
MNIFDLLTGLFIVCGAPLWFLFWWTDKTWLRVSLFCLAVAITFRLVMG